MRQGSLDHVRGVPGFFRYTSGVPAKFLRSGRAAVGPGLLGVVELEPAAGQEHRLQSTQVDGAALPGSAAAFRPGQVLTSEGYDPETLSAWPAELWA
ncbi:hypothetical protein GCM10029992_09420 [Glycomyces albus]